MSKKPVSERDALLRDLRGALKIVGGRERFCKFCLAVTPRSHYSSCPRVAIPAAIRWIRAQPDTFIEFEEVFTVPPRLRRSQMTTSYVASFALPFVMSSDPMPVPTP